MNIPFNKAAVTKKEHFYISEVLASGVMAGDGQKGKACEEMLKGKTGSKSVLLTPSCTAALEMAAILCNISDGDEVIMPSYTFVSTSSAFVLRGGRPVYVDVCPQNMNIDVYALEQAITPKTKAVVIVHYAGISCDMERVMELSEQHGFYVVEDAAQALGSTYRNRPLGTIGHLGCYSFHETKNYTSGGEGGALVINYEGFQRRAEIIREKGTDRKEFFNGLVDKYTWRDIGSSFLMSELQSAYLLAQLESFDEIKKRRLDIWNKYKCNFSDYDGLEIIDIPKFCTHNAHLFYLKLRNRTERDNFINHMKGKGVTCPFHYIPLHASPFGKCTGRFHGRDTFTSSGSDRLVRLPIFFNMSNEEQEYVIENAHKALSLR